MRNAFGKFYSFGHMIAERGVFRTCYVVNDPREYVKVIRAGGKFLSGAVEGVWVNLRWGRERGVGVVGKLLSRGEEWRRIRTFFQKDLLHPDAARCYLPGIARAARLASQGARVAAKVQSSGGEKRALNSYLSRCAFDMFTSMMLGIFTQTADATTPTDPENDAFVRNSSEALSTSIRMLFSPYEYVVGNLLNFETAQMKYCFEGLDNSWAIAQRKVDDFIKRREAGELSENEVVSYLSRALDRQEDECSDVSVKEVMELVFIGLSTAIDTTSSVLA